ncbi:unnamed protein product [Clonostachys rosea]|uniref:Uncharacterized protein n=1 Tax=Bionectria ochroleuca TaxID=29856 RepID=A0ABY6V2Y9_BIOOC|nr:unnamed protein product [Clonostachys rosea]
MDHNTKSDGDLPKVNQHRPDPMPKKVVSLEQTELQQEQQQQAEKKHSAAGAQTGDASFDASPGCSSAGPARAPRPRTERVIKGGLCKARRTKPRFLPKSIPLSAAMETAKNKIEESEGGQERGEEKN